MSVDRSDERVVRLVAVYLGVVEQAEAEHAVEKLEVGADVDGGGKASCRGLALLDREADIVEVDILGVEDHAVLDVDHVGVDMLLED